MAAAVHCSWLVVCFSFQRCPRLGGGGDRHHLADPCKCVVRDFLRVRKWNDRWTPPTPSSWFDTPFEWSRQTLASPVLWSLLLLLLLLLVVLRFLLLLLLLPMMMVLLLLPLGWISLLTLPRVDGAIFCLVRVGEHLETQKSLQGSGEEAQLAEAVKRLAVEVGRRDAQIEKLERHLLALVRGLEIFFDQTHTGAARRRRKPTRPFWSRVCRVVFLRLSTFTFVPCGFL